MIDMEQRYLRLTDVAEKLDVSTRTVTRWIKAGKLVAYKFGNEYRIAEGDFEEFLRRSRTNGGE